MSRFYKSKAAVWPFEGRDDRTGDVTYGDPYLIDCTFKNSNEIRKDSTGREYVTRGMFYTEDDRVKRGDFISIDSTLNANPTNAHEVEDVNQFQRAWRGKSPKFEIVT